VFEVLSGAHYAGGDEEGAACDLGEAMMIVDELLRLRTALYAHVQQGTMNVDVDAAYWTVDRALAGKADATMAVRYAKETLAVLGDKEETVVRQLPTRAISKAEHDALLDGPAPKSVSRDEYERMMREAQQESGVMEGVSRSATFAVAQAALRPEEQPTIAEERPRLTLKVER
jgi:hypothetical protein